MPPQFCVTRPNGDITALIAVDELPPFVSIRGVPRSLSQIDDVHRMINVGTLPSRGQFYTIDVAAEAYSYSTYSSLPNGAPNGEIGIASAITIGASGISHQPGVINAAIWSPDSADRNIINWRSEVNSNAATPIGQEILRNDGSPAALRQFRSQNANNPKTPSKKQYCSFWIRRGECDYSQQGCRFKHEMPRDLETLERLGLRDIPRWFRDKYKVKSLLGSEGMDTRSNVPRSWKTIDQMPDASFPGIGYILPPPIFNAGLPGREATSDRPHYSPIGVPTFASNGTYFSPTVVANGMPNSICSSLSDETTKGNTMFDNTSVSGDFNVLTQVKDIPSDDPNPVLAHNHSLHGFSHSLVQELGSSHAFSAAAPIGFPSTAVSNITSAEIRPHVMNTNFVIPAHTRSIVSGINSPWGMANRNDGDISASLLPPFQSMAVTDSQEPTHPAEPAQKLKARHPIHPQPVHATSNRSVATGNYSLRNTFGVSVAATPVTQSRIELLSSLSSPIPSPTRDPSFRSSHSALTVGPDHDVATGPAHENHASSTESGNSERYSNAHQTLNPIGYNQNGEDFRQRRMTQNEETDPFGLGFNSDAHRPASGHR
ncbi:hypothetical protein PABG_02982 [Paracoccidioides brasiliensis Pb03]|nr:hypothetical protein PABG_02982 [Paracoccidioides brasiliensis Pb03]